MLYYIWRLVPNLSVVWCWAGCLLELLRAECSLQLKTADIVGFLSYISKWSMHIFQLCKCAITGLAKGSKLHRYAVQIGNCAGATPRSSKYGSCATVQGCSRACTLVTVSLCLPSNADPSNNAHSLRKYCGASAFFERWTLNPAISYQELILY